MFFKQINCDKVSIFTANCKSKGSLTELFKLCCLTFKGSVTLKTYSVSSGILKIVIPPSNFLSRKIS